MLHKGKILSTSAKHRIEFFWFSTSDGIRGGITLDAYFKDGADGLGEIRQYKGRTLRVLPNNAMRYAFILMHINLTCNGKTHVLYKNESLGSVKSCRTLMNDIADENDSVSSAMCICLLRGRKGHFGAKFWSLSILVSFIHIDSTSTPPWWMKSTSAITVGWNLLQPTFVVLFAHTTRRQTNIC